MMIKFHRPSSSGSGAAEYLEGETDHKDRPRAGVAVLRGDPFRVGQIADSLDFKHRLTAGVIAWAPEDNPTPEQIDEVLDKFERLAWAGLDPDRYAWSAVRHDGEKGGVHVHIMAARVDLQSRKSLNIAPPYWEYAFAPLRDAMNAKYDWARPDDPARFGEVFLSSIRKKKQVEALRVGQISTPLDKETLTHKLTEYVRAGFINDRASIKAAIVETYLNEADYADRDHYEAAVQALFPREGDNYLSVKPPGADKAFRLRGAIYDRNFNGDAYRATKAAGNGASGRDSATRRAVQRASEEKYHAALEKRRAVNFKKYGPYQDLAENESVLQLPGSAGAGAAHRAAGDVDRGTSDFTSPKNGTRGDPDRTGDSQLRTDEIRTAYEREHDDAGTLGRDTSGDARAPFPETPGEGKTRRRTQQRRRGLVRKSRSGAQVPAGEISHDRTRGTAAGRGDQAGSWHERLVHAIDGNQRALGRFNQAHRGVAKRVVEFFDATAELCRGATEIIVAAREVASALIRRVKKTLTPKLPNSEIVRE